MTYTARILHTQDLAVGYRASRRRTVTIAQNISLRLSAGEMVCLIGPNGVGKSTLMRTLAGMQAPLAGRVILGNMDLHRLPAADRAKRLGIVLTERPNVGLLSGYGLVALGRYPYSNWAGRLTAYDEAVIQWAVEAVGAQNIAANPVMELSDGQRQKLMIARALAQEPQLILLDEPTAFLDLPRRVEMMQLLKQLTRITGRAVLLSTHELDLALRTADTIWLMSNGVIHTGTPEDLILNGAFEAAFQSEGILFDKASGSFNGYPASGYLIAVTGQGIAHTWTRRALERAGFTVSHNGIVPHARVEINGNDSRPIWKLSSGTTETTHTTIGDLLETLHRYTA